MEEYDYVIIGAGPAGLTLAYTLSHLKYRVVLIEKENDIGGCHKVNRVNGLFSEHGPRIYSDAYVNMKSLLGHMGYDFYEMFSRYDPDKWSFFRLKPWELAACAWQYFRLVINPDYGKDYSVQWLTENFSSESRDFIDRLCRMTDGAGSDRYTLHQFLNLFNQNMLHGVYIPKLPNDVGLFTKWKLGDTKLLLGRTVKYFGFDEGKHKIKSITLDDNREIIGKNFLLCLPPQSLVNLIKDTPIQNAFGDYPKLVEWSIQSGYNPYIPIAFHWDSEIEIPKKWGFPVSDWGVAFIVMTRYMKFTDQASKTVISTCIMYNDKPSKVTGKTANESTQQELIDEVFRQLGTAFGKNLPKYTHAIPNKIERENDVWYDKDKAFIVTPGEKFLQSQSTVVHNLYSVGTHNGNSIYSFTTFESALTNALHVLHKIAPESRKEFHIKSPLSLDKIIKSIVFIIIFLFIIIRLTLNRN